jgi:hypothetical protein
VSNENHGAVFEITLKKYEETLDVV